ncbi:MAG TPA: superoxide dismutase family protein [Candidatus Nesterenkonia stercoripullorum]|uniref:Superoxide dismutase [Cu-Zn] n=1 Tax=Candidatus Nesterenkonia stercoripullorum TaxID=2838701 RepID=A0A9D1UQX2_9MICC|nr:superoxide dismutase family protein [Candidatus Nesterenkonia stercoripullorum]
MSTTRDGETADRSLSALNRAPRSVQAGSPLRRATPLFSLALASLLVLSACSDSDPESDPDGEDAAETEEAAADGDENADQNADGESASDDDEEQSDEEENRFAVAELSDAAGNDLGSVEFLEAEGGVDVVVDLTDLNAGFRGMGIHEVGECEPQSSDDSDAVGDFLSAGDHIEGDVDDDEGVVEGEDELEEEEPDVPDRPEGELPEAQPEAGEGTHPQHAGDLPNLLVTEDGTAKSTVTTDRLSSDLLLDDDGSAFIVYASPDNHGNVPERYAPYGVDDETLANGDAGERMACGVIEDG